MRLQCDAGIALPGNSHLSWSLAAKRLHSPPPSCAIMHQMRCALALCAGPTVCPRAGCLTCSGRVIRAELRGELVAAKEMDVGRTLELQRAFISEAQQVRVALGGQHPPC